ncbi:hypothetical protein [Fluviicola sp.]|uniref:hypothetical protein n=1 Tax=Fluviicola sp. TaxID=1917219 RepID=UPI003D280356
MKVLILMLLFPKKKMINNYNQVKSFIRKPVIMNLQVLTVERSTKSLKTPTNFQTSISSERVDIPAQYFEELEVTRKNVRA